MHTLRPTIGAYTLDHLQQMAPRVAGLASEVYQVLPNMIRLQDLGSISLPRALVITTSLHQTTTSKDSTDGAKISGTRGLPSDLM